jgi:hypothetical protein
MLVADLRETFQARGRLSTHGDLREWSNGSLHAYLEPTPLGHRLRMGTTKSNAVATNRFAGISLVAAVVTLLLVLAEAPGEATILTPLILAVAGAAFLGMNALRQPAWALEREQQMEGIAARTLAMLSAEGGGS